MAAEHVRYVATFTPQAWVNDYAINVDPEGKTEWDCTDYMETLSEQEREKAMQPDTDASDKVRDSSKAPDWVKEWSGPFYITVEPLEEVVAGEETTCQAARN